MKKNRKLSEAERLITIKNIAANREDLKQLDYRKRYTKLVLEKGLFVNLQRELQKYSQEIHKTKLDMDQGIDIDWNSYKLEHDTLVYSEGLMWNYAIERKKLQQRLRDLDSEIATVKYTIDVAEKQLNDGVEAK
jgi:hypothetical protein